MNRYSWKSFIDCYLCNIACYIISYKQCCMTDETIERKGKVVFLICTEIKAAKILVFKAIKAL